MCFNTKTKLKLQAGRPISFLSNGAFSLQKKPCVDMVESVAVKIPNASLNSILFFFLYNRWQQQVNRYKHSAPLEIERRQTVTK